MMFNPLAPTSATQPGGPPSALMLGAVISIGVFELGANAESPRRAMLLFRIRESQPGDVHSAEDSRTGRRDPEVLHAMASRRWSRSSGQGTSACS